MDRICHFSTKNDIHDLLLKLGHPMPTKRQLAPHKHHQIKYGAKGQYTHNEGPNPKLDEKGVLSIQAIVAALLFYGRAVDNKLVVAINAIGSQQAQAMETINKAVPHFLTI